MQESYIRPKNYLPFFVGTYLRMYHITDILIQK